MSASTGAAYAQEAAAVVELIDKATAEHLTGPEWHLNLMVCDAANSNDAICDDVVRHLQRRLQSGSPRVILQALVLAETLVKNGTAALHTQVASRTFLQEIAGMTDGSMGFDVQNKALELIKQWADAFAGSSLTAFQDTYRMLKIQGIAFPDVENDVPVFTPPTSVPRSQHASPPPQSASSRSVTGAPGPATSAPAASGPRPSRSQQIAKLHGDLKIVMEKITLFRDLATRGQFGDEAMDDVLDFLRQCQPRMNTLIEGGIMGKLDERTLEECLNVNDSLIKVLDESRASASTGTKEGDLISFDSPRRAHPPTGDLLDNMNSMSLGGRAGV